ncbi:PilW family protein, partial [Psychrobacter frigidicola]|uniref:PilW family protein n=1 Tax=Psychrobacter frigidicola TaxID=45611 RepID=UPI0019185BA9
MKENIPQDILNQYGFTLIELMISLVLGLLISAAVMQVFLTSQRVDRIQTAGSEIQDKAVFGLQSIEPQVRLANLGNDGVAINDMTALGGIVLTAGEYDGSNDRAEQEEQERLEQERLEQERLEQKRLEQKRLEQERLEQERLEQERLEQERLEQERLEQERLEQERLEQ